MNEREKVIHPKLKAAIKSNDYETICKFLCVHHNESDARVMKLGFIQGWKERDRLDAMAKENCGTCRYFADSKTDKPNCLCANGLRFAEENRYCDQWEGKEK